MFKRLVLVFVFSLTGAAAWAGGGGDGPYDPIECLIRCLEQGVGGKSCAYICGG